MESRRHGAAARLRSGSPTRLRSAAQRRNHSHPSQVVIPNTLTNPFQDLTIKNGMNGGARSSTLRHRKSFAGVKPRFEFEN